MSQDDTAKKNPFVTSRRGFLAIAGVGAAGVALAACSSGGSDASPESTTTTTAAPPPTTAVKKNVDLDVAAVAAGLEVLALQTYTAAADAGTAGSLGAVPPAVAEYLGVARFQHRAALAKWNSVLAAGGRPEVTEPNADLKPTVDAEFAKVTDVNGAAALALMLEEIAAATYQKVIPTLTDPAAKELAGSIQVVDAQHVAVLLFVSGQYPVPDTFASTDKAAA